MQPTFDIKLFLLFILAAIKFTETPRRTINLVLNLSNAGVSASFWGSRYLVKSSILPNFRKFTDSRSGKLTDSKYASSKL